MRGVAGLGGWRWIFIIVNISSLILDTEANVWLQEGLLTVIVSVAAYFFIHNYPATAKFLTPEEREHVLARLRRDNDATRNEKFAWTGVRQALKDPKIYLYGLCFHTMSLPAYTLNLFLPTIIKGLGYSAAQAQLLSIPPHFVAFVATMTTAVIAERTKRRAPLIICGSAVGIVGYIMLITSRWSGVSYVGTIIVCAGTFPARAMILSWPANNVSGQTKRVTAYAMQISIGDLGAALGTQLYRPEWGPRYFIGHGTVCHFTIHSNDTQKLVTLGFGLPRWEHHLRQHLVARDEEGE